MKVKRIGLVSYPHVCRHIRILLHIRAPNRYHKCVGLRKRQWKRRATTQKWKCVMLLVLSLRPIIFVRVGFEYCITWQAVGGVSGGAQHGVNDSERLHTHTPKIVGRRRKTKSKGTTRIKTKKNGKNVEEAAE